MTSKICTRDIHLCSVIQGAKNFVLAAELASAPVHLASLNATWYDHMWKLKVNADLDVI
jgi:hypothetical protein